MMASLFTIEQIELVRRLRRTGITKEQVWKAYEEMDRLDAELNGSNSDNLSDSYNKNSVNCVQRTVKSVPNSNSCQTLPQIDINSNSMNEICAKTVASFSRNSQQSVPTQQQHNSYTNERTQDLPPVPQLYNISAVNSTHIDVNGSEESSKEPSITITPINTASSDSSFHSMALIQRPTMSAAVYYGCEEPQELIEFKKRGETLMLSEIRSFVNKYNIRQIMIAEMTKISQGYVSRFFRGEGGDMSEKAKNLIYLWYLSCRNRPEILTQFCPQTIGERRTQLSDAGDLMPIRRDRFIFRKEHLIVLDKYFKENPYPDSSTKEMIAEECNAFIERTTNRLLKDRDKVSTSVVSNWFNNKRKEVKSKRTPSNMSINGTELDNTSQNHNSMQYLTESGLYSNQSSCSVEELETRPDLTMIFNGQDSIELSDDGDSHQSINEQQNSSYINNELKNNFTIKLEPTY